MAITDDFLESWVSDLQVRPVFFWHDFWQEESFHEWVQGFHKSMMIQMEERSICIKIETALEQKDCWRESKM